MSRLGKGSHPTEEDRGAVFRVRVVRVANGAKITPPHTSSLPRQIFSISSGSISSGFLCVKEPWLLCQFCSETASGTSGAQLRVRVGDGTGFS
jgi:hypothetical protein